MQETAMMWWHWLPPQGVCWYKNFFFLFLFWVAICLVLNSGENKYISHIPVQLKACLSTHTEQCSTRRLTVNKESSYFPLFLTMFSKKNHYKRWESCCSVFYNAWLVLFYFKLILTSEVFHAWQAILWKKQAKKPSWQLQYASSDLLKVYIRFLLSGVARDFEETLKYLL